MSKPRATENRVMEAYHLLNLRHRDEFGVRDEQGFYGYMIVKGEGVGPGKRWSLEYPGAGGIIPPTSARNIIDLMEEMPY